MCLRRNNLLLANIVKSFLDSEQNISEYCNELLGNEKLKEMKKDIKRRTGIEERRICTHQ
jgi:hypothetical protein